MVHIRSVRFSGIHSNDGFTLIELLIVIAIILILIAIALPNFLEAQLRARVTKVRGEMRTVATALESYQIDWRTYPWAAEIESLHLPALPPAESFELFLPAILTSPVAYMTQLLPDVFRNESDEGSDQDVLAPFHYTETETDLRLGEPNLLSEVTAFLFGSPRGVRYFLLSHGPDADHDEPEVGLAVYSPTNGSKSNGDIYFFGPSGGFN